VTEMNDPIIKKSTTEMILKLSLDRLSICFNEPNEESVFQNQFCADVCKLSADFSERIPESILCRRLQIIGRFQFVAKTPATRPATNENRPPKAS
jgi:hypothetical protein